MKFPLAPRPFEPLHLSQQQSDEHERTAMDVLLETIDEYDDFVHKENRRMDMKLWKVAKKRDNITVYKRRDREAAASSNAPTARNANGVIEARWSSSSTSAFAITEWTLPKLLGVGTIVGSLDDVMYGVISPDMDAIKVKTTYVDDEIVDSELLHCIHHPNMEDPYRFLAIKWFVKAHPASVNAITKPRDFTFIESTGNIH